MLAGLIFATEDADDRADSLAATLPFCGSSLIEYQARLLLEAGATQLLIAVGRVTPALLGAASRIGRRGLAVDLVRSADEAAARLHPLAKLLVFADALVTTEEIVRLMASEPAEALLVADPARLPAERIDADSCWAGLARLDASLLREAARLPGDYDLQSSLLRLAVANGAVQVALPADALAAGHGIERNAAALGRRSNAVVAALAGGRTPWADRWVLGSAARLVVPMLVARGAPGGALLAGGGAAALGGLVAAGLGWAVTSLILALVALALFSGGALMSWLTGAERLADGQEHAGRLTAAAVVLLVGAAVLHATGTGTALALAAALVTAAALTERAARFARRRRWWGSAAGYLLVLIPFAVLGWLVAGLACAAAYAALTLADAIERGRERP